MKYLILLLLIIPNTYAFLEITEVMYNPEGTDNNYEYVELKTDMNLSNYSISDLQNEDLLILLQNSDSDYSLIVEEGFNYTGINATIYSAGSTIGYYGLNNNNDTIIISNNGTILDTLHYYSQWGANSNGKSLCKLDHIWQNCNPTPGYENDQENILQNYTIEITEFLPDPEGYDSAPMPDGEWIELFNYGNQDINLNGYIINDDYGNGLIISNINVLENTIIKANDFLVIYRNEDEKLILTNDGLNYIQLYNPDNQLITEVEYSFSKEGNSWSKINNTWHLTIPTPGESNPNNPEQAKESNITIENIYLGNDDKAKFGDNLRVRLNIYKGDETKESIKAYIEKNNEKISKTTSFNIIKKFSENIITIPIQIFPNCNLKNEEGEYELIIEGLNEKTKETITIEGITKNLCEKQTCTEENIVNYMEKLNLETVINQDSQANEIVYESKGKKTSKSGIYFFTLILVLLTIQMIIEKWKK